MPSTVERLLDMLHLIPRAPRKITAAELLSKLEDEGYKVTKRTVERNLQAVSARFALVCDDRDRSGGYGWSWRNGAVHDLPGMDPPTALTFLLAQQFLEPALPRSTLGLLEPHFDQARKVLNSPGRKHFGHWLDKVRILPRGQKLIGPEVKPAVLEPVYTALLKEQRLAVRYRPRDRDRAAEYEVNPLGLVIRDAVIYLVCTLWDYDDLKQLALHRMNRAELLGKQSRRPPDFDLDAYIDQGAFAMPFGGKDIQLAALFVKNKHASNSLPVLHDRGSTCEQAAPLGAPAKAIVGHGSRPHSVSRSSGSVDS